MILPERTEFNQHFTADQYRALLQYFPDRFGITVPFRIAETPVFLSDEFRDILIEAGEELLAQLLSPELLMKSLGAIPRPCFVPGEMGTPNFIALDFGICSDGAGGIVPQLIECQAFPSLYGFQAEIGKAYKHFFSLPADLTEYFHGLTENGYIQRLRDAVIANENPDEVILLEIDPWNQSTAIDFAITETVLGIKTVALEEVFIRNDRLFYRRNGQDFPVRRIYNRVIFDELHRRSELRLAYHLTEVVDVQWAIHPNWYFRISKFLLPHLKGPYIPETFYLNELKTPPLSLENYVLKPLYSFSGAGVLFDVHPRDLQAITEKENFILQKKVTYIPCIQTPDGRVKAEIRLLYLWDHAVGKPVLVTNLCRLSKGDMIGVKFNRDKTWVGGSVALFH